MRRPRRWGRIVRRTLLGFLLLIGLVVLFGLYVAAPILRQKLQAMVSDSLNAELTMDSLSYQFPYGLRAKNAALVAKDEHGQSVDLLRVKELELALAEIPWGERPLVIERLIVNEPAAHWVMEEHGLVGGRGLVKEEARQRQHHHVPGKAKPSDYFRLRRLAIHEGAIVYEDRRSPRPGQASQMVWKNLAVELNTAPTSGSLYSYEVSARNAPLALANVRGRFDIDELLLDVEKLVLGVKVERGRAQEQLPPMLQEALKRYEVAGGLTITASARVPLRDPSRATYEALLDLPSASARVSEGEGRLDRVALKLRVNSEDREAATREVERPVALSAVPTTETHAATRPPPSTRPARQQPPPTVVRLDLLDVGTHDTLLHVEKGEAVIDPATQQWRVKELLCRLDVGRDRSGLPSAIERVLGRFELSGKVRLTATAVGPLRPLPNVRVADQIDYQVIAYPRELTVRPPKWTSPFTNVSGVVRANREAVVFENVEGRYFEDRYFVTGARIPLDNVTSELRINEITGSAVLTGKVEDYPKPFEFPAKQLRPSGTWHAIGWFARKRGLKPGEKPEFRFDFRSDDAGGTVGPRRIPLTDVKAEISIDPKLVEIRRLEGRSLSGTVTAEGQVTPGNGPALNYQGSGWVRNVDVKALGKLLSKDGQEPRRLSGKGNLNVRVHGTGADGSRTALDNLAAAGRFEVLEGEFWDLSVIKDVASGAKVASDALTVGQAAGVFEIRDRVVELKSAALSAPVLGLQGSGRVGFDGRLDLRVVAAPLADWKDQMKRTKIPLLSDVAGELLGGLQAMINKASKTLLYEFHVTGTTKQPKLETVPAPALTEGVAKLFGAMLKGEKLSDSMNGESRQKK